MTEAAESAGRFSAEELEQLKTLAERWGIFPFYWDVRGVQHHTSDAARAEFLSAMGANLEQPLNALQYPAPFSICPPVAVFTARETARVLPLFFQTPGSCRWTLIEESGKAASGEISESAIAAAPREQNQGVAAHLINFNVWQLPLGYHWFEINAAGDSAAKCRCLIVVAPERCYQPPELEGERRIWGLSVQLYSLGAGNRWGIGDFGDLKRFVQTARRAGASAIGLNPLHAVSIPGESEISPYSPSSRRALHALYIDLDAAADALGCLKLDPYEPAAGDDLIDYARVSRVKWTALSELYGDFSRRGPGISKDAILEFSEFELQAPQAIKNFALFCALHEYARMSTLRIWGWHQWDPEFHNAAAPEVVEFAESRAERVRFYMFVQWLLHTQLSEIQLECKTGGMELGLYLDLALGSRFGAADSWIDRDLYASGVNMGAPPDELAPQGQDWGLPPYNPHKLRQAHYKPLIEALQENMQYAGALRIDHVMSLFRLFWVLPNHTGAYVRYPLRELTAIIALESARNRCLIIGEDLGTVPDEVRHEMSRSGVYSYKVLMFMKDDRGEFLNKNSYPAAALVTASTHDLPTLRGYWTGHDLEVRSKLNLHPPEVLEQLAASRNQDRQALLRTLIEAGDLTPAEAEQLKSDGGKGGESFQPLLRAGHAFLAGSKCKVMMLQIEDLTLQLDQMNLPGTMSEHPNWRRKTKLDLDSPPVQSLLAKIAAIRAA